jgi:hypothetical protein
MKDACNAPIPGTQNLCTRDAGHTGEHRCRALDVDNRKRTGSAEQCPARPIDAETALRITLSYFTDPDGGNPEYTEAVVREALAGFGAEP